MAGYLALWSVYWLFRLLTGKRRWAMASCWRRWAPVRLAGSAAGAVARFGQRAGVDPTATPVDPAVAAAAAGLRLALAGGVFSLAADGLAFAIRLAGQDAARQRRLRVFCCGGSGRRWPDRPARRASDSVLHLFLHLAVAPLPEGAQIAGDLQRTLGRRQQLQHQRHPPSAITGVVASPNISCIRTASAGGFSAWYRIAGGCRSARYSASAARDPALAQRPWQPVL